MVDDPLRAAREQVGSNLRRIREALGITEAELATRAAVALEDVRAVERGEWTDAQCATRIARVLDPGDVLRLRG